MKSFKQLREEIQLDELNLDTHKSAQDRKKEKITDTWVAQKTQPHRSKNWAGDAQGGVSTKKRIGQTEEYDYDVEAMLEYIEDLETQLDEVSHKLKMNAYNAARAEQDKIMSQYEPKGNRAFKDIPGITPEHVKRLTHLQQKTMVFDGTANTKTFKDKNYEANRKALYGGDPNKNPGGLGS